MKTFNLISLLILAACVLLTWLVWNGFVKSFDHFFCIRRENILDSTSVQIGLFISVVAILEGLVHYIIYRIGRKRKEGRV